MNKRFLLAATLTAAPVLASQAVSAQTIYGVTPDDTFFVFDAANPAQLTFAAPVTGLMSGETIRGIDVRPATLQLYALGSLGNLYIINPSNAVASMVATLSVPLSGTSFGMDFNPVPDRLRVVSNTGQNLRINVDTGATIVDGMLSYPSGGAVNITAAGYINNFAGATTTALYNIDTNLDVLTLQSPPNDGVQQIIGPLGIDVSSVGGLDILTVGMSNIAYAALTPTGGSVTNLYTINLGTGQATLVGQIDGGLAVTDIAVAIPEPSSLALLALGGLVLRRRRRG